jgi:hypothetical protein
MYFSRRKGLLPHLTAITLKESPVWTVRRSTDLAAKDGNGLSGTTPARPNHSRAAEIDGPALRPSSSPTEPILSVLPFIAHLEYRMAPCAHKATSSNSWNARATGANSEALHLESRLQDPVWASWGASRAHSRAVSRTFSTHFGPFRHLVLEISSVRPVKGPMRLSILGGTNTRERGRLACGSLGRRRFLSVRRASPLPSAATVLSGKRRELRVPNSNGVENRSLRSPVTSGRSTNRSL